MQLTPALWRVQLRRWLALGDGLVITVGSLLAYVTREQLGRAELAQPLADEVPIAIAIIPLWLLIFALAGAYRPEYLNAGGDGVRRFLVGVGGGVLTLGFASFLFNLQLSRLFVLFVALYVLVGGGVLRAAGRRWIRRRHERGELVLYALIVGTDQDAQQLAGALERDRDSSYRVSGYLDESAPLGSLTEDGRTVLGRPSDVIELAAELGIGLVIVSPVGVSRGTLQDVILDLEGTPVDVAVAPSLFQIVTRRMTIETVGYVPILHVDQVRLGRPERILKRAVDLLAASALLLLSLPLWLWAAIRVRAGSPGPVLFRQQRVGQDGQLFEMLKFRTMVPDAEDRLPEVEHLNEAEGAFFKVAEDPRVTPVGRTLRRWSIDELPQLVNVLRGEMSMVGPRPPLPSEVATYEDWHLRRLRVRPGITGIWQVSGRSDVPFDEAVRLDLFYIENWSLGTDVALLARTVRAVLNRRGAW
ncbi:sugar transferase [Nitriliruptor alkaliphilus]|uniref:sugar transferase n=1 Tax=Nitriliruptor alkaliphilus TaxID=427918 RepID=UPI000695D6BD|nr:sugar transferase [Nitriliruptor alkaliphilus]